jgi:transcriptional regulator with XRE-family HTH domain
MEINVEKIESIREGKGVSRKELAKAIGLTYAAFYGIVQRRKSTKLDTISNIAKVLNVNPFELLK